MEPPSFLQPIIEALPPDVQRFLNAGGWVVVAVLLGLIVLLLFGALVRRLFRGRAKPPPELPTLTEDLSTYPPPPPLWGNQRLTVYGLPVRVRLVVAAPLGYEAGEIHAEAILNQVVPGLGQAVRTDKPRIRIWPTQFSYPGFVAAFRRHTLTPDPDAAVTRWVLLMGKALVNRRPLAVGLALLADQESTLGRVTLEHPHQWMEALRVKALA
jgi:hypothetical protein